MASDHDISKVKDYLLGLQDNLCAALKHQEPQKVFHEDRWERKEGGGGRTRVLQHGEVLESAGVNFSHVMGESLPASATASRPELANRKFTAMGVSSVVHPLNPMAPTAHMNVRLFVAEKDGADPIWWFGGGYDLTPYYGFDEDCAAFHQEAKKACDAFHVDAYPRYKKWADDYFYIKHRQEPRGVGGIFFDDLNTHTWGWDFATCFAFLKKVGDGFEKAYVPLIEKRKNMEYSSQQKEFQQYRRGRYVEFNLVYDRGTLFGLQSNGRTESILMSLPPQVRWAYDWSPEAGSQEAKLYDHYLKPQNWAG